MSILKKSPSSKATARQSPVVVKASAKSSKGAKAKGFEMPEPLYINDSQGKPAGVYLTVEQFENICAELEDLADKVWALERIADPDPNPNPMPLAGLKEQLKKAGRL